MTDKPEVMSGETLDIAKQRRAELKQLFPGVFTETTDANGKVVETVDFERLKAELGTFSDVYEGRRERYGMDWPGKRDCMKLIQEPTRATLKPCREESVDFDNTKNLFIEGDNLEVLKLLQKSYYGKVKMIYIDPPYNTGKEFIYPDNYREGLDTYLKYSGMIDDEGNKFATNTASEGRFHTRWMNMMYPRLYLARNLLSEDGYFIASIDDAEVNNLSKILNEIFGEENLLATLVFDRNRKNDAKYISVGHEYMLVYAKNMQHLVDCKIVLREQREGLAEAKKYYTKLVEEFGDDWEAIRANWLQWFENFPISDPRRRMLRFNKVGRRGPYRDDGNISWPGGGGPRYEIKHPVTGQPVPVPSRGWVYPSERRFWEEYENGKVVFGEDHSTSARIASYLFESDGQVMPSVFYSYAQTATQEFSALMGAKVFDNPKNWKDIARLVSYFTSPGDIVLDFFAGSSSTAQAVLEISRQESEQRKFIMVQLPEPCDEKSIAFDRGYKNIAELSRDRINNAISGILISNENDISAAGRFGYRTYKLDSSVFKTWNIDSDVSSEEILGRLELYVNHVDDTATQEEILFELLLKSGFGLEEKIHELELVGKTVYAVSDGALIICLDEDLTTGLIDEVVSLEPMQFICLDKAFNGNDQLKANAVQTFKAKSQNSESELVFKVV